MAVRFPARACPCELLFFCSAAWFLRFPARACACELRFFCSASWFLRFAFARHSLASRQEQAPPHPPSPARLRSCCHPTPLRRFTYGDLPTGPPLRLRAPLSLPAPARSAGTHPTSCGDPPGTCGPPRADTHPAPISELPRGVLRGARRKGNCRRLLRAMLLERVSQQLRASMAAQGCGICRRGLCGSRVRVFSCAPSSLRLPRPLCHTASRRAARRACAPRARRARASGAGRRATPTEGVRHTRWGAGPRCARRGGVGERGCEAKGRAERAEFGDEGGEERERERERRAESWSPRRFPENTAPTDA